MLTGTRTEVERFEIERLSDPVAPACSRAPTR
jgi:hypothetical protein